MRNKTGSLNKMTLNCKDYNIKYALKNDNLIIENKKYENVFLVISLIWIFYDQCNNDKYNKYIYTFLDNLTLIKLIRFYSSYLK